MSEDYFKIKVRSLDSSQFELSVSPEMSVSKLKVQISELTGTPIERQRLIYQGKLLKEEECLSRYKLAGGHVVQLLSSSVSPASSELPPADDLFSRRRRQLQRRREIDISERLETIRQNLETIECMLRSRRTFISDPDNIEAFDLSQRHFSPGQWVDVKDTVDQWLEAQVVDLQNTPEGPILYIHYNGWPNRWDEWISASSSRVQYLRTYTLQSLASPMQSPHPVIPCDAEEIQPPSVHSINDYIMQSSYILERVRALMDHYHTLSALVRQEQSSATPSAGNNPRAETDTEAEIEIEIEEGAESEETIQSDNEGYDFTAEEEETQRRMTPAQELNLLTLQVAPILDRTGRLVTDMAAFMGNNRQSEDSVPVMASPLQLASVNPRSPGLSGQPDEDRNSCWRQIS